MERERFLSEHTFSEAGFDVGRRVYETLAQMPTATPLRTAKLLGLLIECLERKELLDASEIDDMLIEVI